MYFFFLDNSELQQLLPSFNNPNMVLTMGTNSNVETTDPTANVLIF